MNCGRQIMGDASKLKKLITTHRGPGEVQDWIFSLTPIGVAFVFYLVFIMSANIEPKGLFIAYGAAAGFVGLESYWIIRGWRKNHAITIVTGFIGIAITLGLLRLYLSLIM
jgi:hypothetical protein